MQKKSIIMAIWGVLSNFKTKAIIEALWGIFKTFKGILYPKRHFGRIQKIISGGPSEKN